MDCFYKKPLLSFIDLETVTVSRFDVTALACVTAQKYNYVLKGFSSCQSLNTIISSLSNRRTPARCLADLLSSCRDKNNVQLLIQRWMLFISSNQTTNEITFVGQCYMVRRHMNAPNTAARHSNGNN